ncbi:MAG TPA: prepilin-type N-terminal cleavage/methylation domain-containing protein [Candidatus Absconditabacterales bacterium]|nr:prepilin-type N-terminal cleavage/methylation domain-containing protein [Candidatus Absconditabacterales bacterium]
MKKKIKAFTVLEIVIVIVIVGVLMGATMKFGGDRIGFLNQKNIKEQFLSSYENLYSQNLLTSYKNKKIYNKLELNFEKGSNHIGYQYLGYNDDLIFSGRTFVDGGDYQISQLFLDGEEQDLIKVYLKPYDISCDLDEHKQGKICILVNKSKEYCFLIKKDNCRINNF